MKAVVLRKLGEPEIGEFQSPSATASQEVVNVSAAGIGPADRIVSAGLVPVLMPELPSVVGKEGVGRMDGKRIYFDSPISPFGAFGEQALIDPATAIDVPENVTDEQAIMSGLSGSTAWIVLSSRAKVQPGENVLVLGATGAVGKMATQAAKLLGAGRVIAAARPGATLEATKELGADATVALEGDAAAMAAKMGEASRGKIDVVVDLLWGQPAVASLLAASPKARLVALGVEAGMEVNLSSVIMFLPQTSILGFSMKTVPIAVKREAFATVADNVRKGKMKLPIAVFPLSDFRAAWKRSGQSPYVKVILDLTK
jgi:NADPH:quinone reductase-like Zn-dependent oxidoreductase